MFHIEYELRQNKHLTDTPLHFSIRKKEVNAMTCEKFSVFETNASSAHGIAS